MKKYYLILVATLSLCILVSCKPQSSEYNLGLKNGTSGNLQDVKLALNPKGSHFGFVDAPPNHCGWYMYITHWVPPKAVIVSFNAPDGKSYKFKKKTSLTKDFQGDILITIKKNKNGYYIEIKTAKLRELSLG